MAESMLLLVFCLLLVAAAIIKAERDRANTAVNELHIANSLITTLEKEKNDAVAQNKLLKNQMLQLATVSLSPAEKKKFEDEWRELDLAKQTVEKLREQGLSPERLEKLQATLTVLEKNDLLNEDPKVVEARLEKLKADEKDLAELIETLALAQAELGNARLELESARDQLAASKPHEWPPIINLSEANKNFFRSGSAELTPEFADKLRGMISNEISDNLEKYQVDIIEVIGHTDEQPLARASSNLDETYIDVIDGKKSIDKVLPADNAGLGLARAIAVTNILKTNPKLAKATILPMSAAQLILPGDILTTGQLGNVEARRRIEIRIRRRNVPQTP
ncbi:OmpA family protein [Rhizobium sp. TH2]|uniref:OmpA family protein n=1 Tax=Rhizobium sp. TH2 TaxID=2775403 RepID=UPI0021580B1C|nr:OmpA family protein [Rhizobium sp. TH2]UVC08960.1 OmpA family protein [Rhizobium sp. TH2]